MALKPAVRIAYRRLARSRFAPVLRLPAVQCVHRRLTSTSVSDVGAVEIIRLLGEAGVRSTLLGGWGCDALLGEQTRPHADVDLLVSDADRERALAALEDAGFERIYTFDSPALAAQVVELTDHRTRRCASLHFTDLESDEPLGFRRLMQTRLTEAGYGAGELFATGAISGRDVRSVSPALQLVLISLGPESEGARRDSELLRARFSLRAPTDDA